ncbi:MAG: HlyD family efflux transporter periplasmic adaptor subunit [Brevundimonas sp.]|uniref:HlyD family secretion protein n=1 Tax=Brevundimonas sp. TaxID=1871086 RepID=UPI002487E984|nr:HlyD family efflux transporter periplasmic adaptor subunit [Brevundimonas sp.]MDI1328163.1 HlyD family efflux transporter periplasmic adaptor subunit [Brevundimonas sp.]
MNVASGPIRDQSRPATTLAASKDLFRRQAITHAAGRLTGNVILASSVSLRLLTFLLVAIVLAVTVFAATASYARKETVSGWLTPPAGLIRLTARDGGVVERVLVSEGELVKAGQPIATLRLSRALEQGDAFSALSASLSGQQGAARDRASATRETLGAERSQLIRRRGGLSGERAEARRRVQLQRQRLALANDQVPRAEAIAAQGFMPGRELEARRSAALQADLALSEITAQVLEYERQISEVDSRLAAIPIDLRAAEAEVAAVRAKLVGQETRTEAEAIYNVVATVAGRIAALPTAPGQSVAAGATLAIVTPGDGPLEAELYAPSRAAGFVREGQEVRLMYQPFPHQKFGSGAGRITSVSRTVLAPDEVAVRGLKIDGPVFRVRVRLDRESVSAYGREIPMRPGMLLTADVIIDRRNLLEWLLDPLYAAGRRG